MVSVYLGEKVENAPGKVYGTCPEVTETIHSCDGRVRPPYKFIRSLLTIMSRGKFMKPLETLRGVLKKYDGWDEPIKEEVGQENVKIN